MVELRWVVHGQNRQLEYRTLIPHTDASGGFCPPGEWSNWKPVPAVSVDDASWEDVLNSGGIFPENGADQ